MEMGWSHKKLKGDVLFIVDHLTIKQLAQLSVISLTTGSTANVDPTTSYVVSLQTKWD